MKDVKMFRKGIRFTGSYLQGIKSVFSSLGLLGQHRGLIAYFIVPFLINIIILTSVFYFSYTIVEPRLAGAITGEGWYFDVLRVMIAPVMILLLGIISVLLFSIAGNIITAPFNDFLSAAVERRLGDKIPEEPFTITGLLADISRITKNIFRMLGLLLGANILLLVVNFIPLVGSILYTILSFSTTAFFLGFQFFDFPLERRRFAFREKLTLLWRFRALTAGVGTGFFLASLIPLVGFLSLNLGTMAATLLFLEHMKPALTEEKGEIR
ncbi:MAG: hypothetical protein CVV44_07580 [Spirochaetae bacterium HGW-Spirochaetae-1]|jgi:CysZ protein|nr:MAG: hypothetical protein CVV44_07580 [Spirochaetae bacterium HGW-Spirochaetae-1]